METKKHLKKDVSTKHTLFTQIGMIVAIAICIWAFSWQRTLHEDILIQIDNGGEPFIIAELQIPKVEVKNPKQEAPEPPSNNANRIEIVENEVEIGEEAPEVKDIELIEIPVGPPQDLGEIPPMTDEPTEFPKDNPEFPGGNDARDAFLKRNINYSPYYNWYYADTRQTVMVKFIVQPDGSITDIEILKTFSDEAAEQVVNAFKKMPKWIPGKNHKNQIATIILRMPIYFDIK